MPFAWDGDPALGELPVDGWDGVIWRSARDRQIGQKPNLVSALEITVPADLQGTGLSGKMLAAMRDNVERLGFEDLVAPVRPNRKHLVPDMPIEAYAALVREDGLPQDPWLRVHVRAGGRIVATCKRAMVIPGTLDEWRSWTGLPFDESGPVVVPGALVPVQCSVEHDYAVYVARRCGCTTGCEPGPGLTGRLRAEAYIFLSFNRNPYSAFGAELPQQVHRSGHARLPRK